LAASWVALWAALSGFGTAEKKAGERAVQKVVRTVALKVGP